MSVRGLIIMGVSGSGKTTVGRAVAQNLGWEFLDADDFHPPENVAKMAAGIPLTDEDREPWLAELQQLIHACLERGQHPVLACSALKEKYRQRLLEENEGVKMVYLKGSYDLIWSRMVARSGHYMKADLLRSQFAALEEPVNALVVGIQQLPDEIAQEIIQNVKSGLDNN